MYNRIFWTSDDAVVLIVVFCRHHRPDLPLEAGTARGREGVGKGGWMGAQEVCSGSKLCSPQTPQKVTYSSNIVFRFFLCFAAGDADKGNDTTDKISQQTRRAEIMSLHA